MMGRYKLIVGVVLVALFMLLGYKLVAGQRFRLVAVEPRGKGSTMAPVIFTFDRPINPSTSREFEIKPYVPGVTTVLGNKVVFKPTNSYSFNAKYSANLHSVLAEDGKRLGTQSTQFTATFIPAAQLTPADQKTLLDNTDSTEKIDPFLGKLPHETLEYKIDYKLDPGLDKKIRPYLVITLYAILNKPSQKAEYQRQLQVYKDNALAWIVSQGVDPKAYPTTYIPAL